MPSQWLGIIPVAMPGFADGRTTVVTVCHLVEPRAKLTSRYASGTALMASSDVLTIVGSIITDRVRLRKNGPAEIQVYYEKQKPEEAENDRRDSG